MIDERMKALLREFLELHVESVFDEHRLAYMYLDEDTDPEKAIQLFVCKCNEAFVRRKFNEHLKEKLKEVA